MRMNVMENKESENKESKLLDRDSNLIYIDGFE